MPSLLIEFDLSGSRQLAFARFSELLPGLGHLLKLLTMGGRRCSRHTPTFGSMLAVLFDFSH